MCNTSLTNQHKASKVRSDDVVLQQILDKIKKKEKRDRQKSDKIKLSHKYKSERKPISHEQYNTRYEVSSILNELRKEIWSEPSEQKIQ